MRHRVALVAFLAAGLLFAVAAQGWLGKGHQQIARVAVESLKGTTLPAFMLDGAGTIAHNAVDPDIFTRPIAPKELHDATFAEHFFDIEVLAGAKIPPGRYEFIDLCAAKGIKPTSVGLLPYAVVESTERLAVVLAEHRRWPDDRDIQAKCLVYAGLLAHYAGDLEQPLHTSIHYDGRAKADGTSPRTGIHLKVDALIGELSAEKLKKLGDFKPKAYEKLLPAVLDELAASHAMVDKVYELEKDLPPVDTKELDPSSPCGQFAVERSQTAAKFIANLYVTAWVMSEQITIPAWHRNENQAATGPATRPTTSPTTGATTKPTSGATVAVGGLLGRAQQARLAAAKTDIAMIKTALQSFEVDCGRYPTTDEGLNALMTKPQGANGWGGPYFTKLPTDPWGNAYQYACPATRKVTGGFDLYSLGPDGQDRTEDDVMMDRSGED